MVTGLVNGELSFYLGLSHSVTPPCLEAAPDSMNGTPLG